MLDQETFRHSWLSHMPGDPLPVMWTELSGNDTFGNEGSVRGGGEAEDLSVDYRQQSYARRSDWRLTEFSEERNQQYFGIESGCRVAAYFS